MVLVIHGVSRCSYFFQHLCLEKTSKSHRPSKFTMQSTGARGPANEVQTDFDEAVGNDIERIEFLGALETWENSVTESKGGSLQCHVSPGNSRPYPAGL